MHSKIATHEINIPSFTPDGDGLTADNSLRLTGVPFYVVDEYLFSWNDIPGKDNGRLIEYLNRDLVLIGKRCKN